MSVNITTIGGWSGSFQVLSGIKHRSDFNISAVISVADSGGTTGAIRDKYGILPPGDMRRGIAALAKNTVMVRKLFDYSFTWEEGVIGGNKIGNILLTALVDITGSFEKAVITLSDMLDVRGRVIPVTLEDVQLAVEFEDWTVVIGEKNIDVSETNPWVRSHNVDQNITKAWLEGNKGTLNPRAREAIMNSDFIILGPGDLYTSIIPNLLSFGMREVLDMTPAKIIYVCNVMTKRGETTNMEVNDFISTIEHYIAPWKLDYVIVNNGVIDPDIVVKYKEEENKKPLVIKDYSLFRNASYTIIERDIINDDDYVRHDPRKLATILEDIIQGWIK